VPCDVAVQEPCTWVVGLEGNDGVTLGSQHGSVTTRWVDKVQCANLARGEGTLSLANESKVVTVQMHWVRDKELILNHEVDPLVLLGEDSKVFGFSPGGVGAVVAGFGELLKSWVGWVKGHGAAVKIPAEDGAVVSSDDGVQLTCWESGCLGAESAGCTGRQGNNGVEACDGFVLADTCNITEGEASDVVGRPVPAPLYETTPLARPKALLSQADGQAP